MMFEAGGCSSCHAIPNQVDKQQLGGGRALHSPFGTFYVPNISTDPHDGIGAWTEAQFITAMIKGTSPTGQHYYPAFPYTSYQRMKLDDLRDLFAYVKTLPSVQGKVRSHDLPFPFSIRRGVGLWKQLFLDGNMFQPDPTKSTTWNRGAYLVNGPAHCLECHSPRNIFGAVVQSQLFAGGPNPEGKGFIPNITQLGLKDCRKKTSHTCSRLANHLMETSSDRQWPRSFPILHSFPTTIGPRLRPTSSRCRQSRAQDRRTKPQTEPAIATAPAFAELRGMDRRRRACAGFTMRLPVPSRRTPRGTPGRHLWPFRGLPPWQPACRPRSANSPAQSR
jgi:mono/diheme cytochrome c family protein